MSKYSLQYWQMETPLDDALGSPRVGTVLDFRWAVLPLWVYRLKFYGACTSETPPLEAYVWACQPFLRLLFAQILFCV